MKQVYPCFRKYEDLLLDMTIPRVAWKACHQTGGLYSVYLPAATREWMLTLKTSFQRESHDSVEGNIAEEFFPEMLTSLASITYPRAA